MMTSIPRSLAVAETIARLRELLQGDAPPPGALATAEAIVRTLAARAELWPAKDFPIPEGRLWHAHRLHEDSDGQFAMYAVPMRPGHAQPPHDHTTWALIAGVRGRERNCIYARPVTGAAPAPLLLRGEVVIGTGDVLSLGPADVHTIEVLAPDEALHLHVYGRGLAHLEARRIFDPATGAERPFPPMPA